MACEIRAQRLHVTGIFDKEILGGFRESRCVRQNVAQRNRLGKRVRNLEVQIIVYVAIKVEPALLHELHHGSPGKELRNGSWAEKGVLWRNRPLGRDIGVSISSGEENLSVLNNCNNRARDVATLELQRHEPVEKGFQVRRGEFSSGFPRGRLL